MDVAKCDEMKELNSFDLDKKQNGTPALLTLSIGYSQRKRLT